MCSNIALFLNLVRAGLSYKEKDLQNKALFGENWLRNSQRSCAGAEANLKGSNMLKES